MKYFFVTVVTLVAAVVVVGFVFGGSPGRARLVRLDEARVRDMQQLESLVMRYWEIHQALPDSLEEAAALEPRMPIPKDPETDGVYRYEKTGNLMFQLCTVFAESNEGDGMYSDYMPRAIAPYGGTAEYQLIGQDWRHPTGEYCFERKIELVEKPAAESAAEKK